LLHNPFYLVSVFDEFEMYICWEMLYLVCNSLPDNTASVLSFHTGDMVMFLPVLRILICLDWEKGSVSSVLQVSMYIVFRHLLRCTNYISDRSEVSKWSIQMLAHNRFTVVWCLSCTGWGGNPVESKYTVVQVKAIKLGSVRRGRTEPI